MCQVCCSSIQCIYAQLTGGESICQVWCSGIQGIYAQLTGEGPSTKFGVAVFKVSMLDWRVGGQSAMGICALFYICIDLPLDVPSLV